MAMLDVEGVFVRFGGVRALEQCRLAVDAGTLTALIGPNGSGKTTLLDAVTGRIRPAAGAIRLDGTDLVGRAPAAIARLGVIRTFQQVRVFRNLTVAQHLALARGGGTLDGRAALDEVGLDAPLAARAGDLSYGQRKLLEIAVALAAPHRLLLLDEPAAGLGPEPRARLADALRRERLAGRTLLVVEHDMPFILPLADRVVVLADGIAIAAGSPADVRADERVRAAYLGGATGRPEC